MDTTRLAVLIALACGALVDILILAYATVTGLDHALNNPAQPKSIAILALMVACFAAPPIAFSAFRKNNYLFAFIAVCTPMTLAVLAGRWFGI
jgi:hypothetical protein